MASDVSLKRVNSPSFFLLLSWSHRRCKHANVGGGVHVKEGDAGIQNF